MINNPYRDRQLLRWQESESRKIAVELNDRQQRTARPMPSIATIIKGFSTVFINISAAVSAVFVILVFIEIFYEQPIIVEPIQVPKQISENGFSAEIAALRLRDKINVLVKQTKHLLNLKKL